MRGDKELECLNAVKKAVFRQVNRLFYFGLLKYDREEFEDVLRIAQANPDESCFPDLIFRNGFIEHFQITSSNESRKGATHTKREREFRRVVDTEMKQIESTWNETPSFDEVRSKSWVFSNPTHSYEFLFESFKRNWENHINSYRKYTGSKQIGIFMIEYPESALTMHENVYHNWINGMSQGDMRGQEEFREYRLSRDKKLLKYIYQFRDEIQYVVFRNQVRVEVIRTENIPCLIELLPWDYIICPLQTITVASIKNISVPTDFIQGGDEHDKS